MRTRIALSILSVLNLPLTSHSQNGYEITGKINGIPDKTKFFLVRNRAEGADTVETTISNLEEFKFQGWLKEEGELFFIKMDTTNLFSLRGKTSYVRLILDNTSIKISGDIKEWPEAKIEGSTSTDLIELMNKRAELFDTKISQLDPIRDSVARNIEGNSYRMFIDSISNVNRNSTASAAIFNFFRRNQLSESDQKRIFERLSDRVKNSFYGMRWKEEQELLKTRSSIKADGYLPDFSFKKPNGVALNITQAIKEAKYTLIDFWASWCIPCRNEIPIMNKIYNEFKEDGFNIIGISVLDKEVNWKKALEQDKAPWLQGIDDGNKIGTLFGFNSLPAYILVDSTGRLLAYECTFSGVKAFGDSLRGDNLSRKLSELLRPKLP